MVKTIARAQRVDSTRWQGETLKKCYPTTPKHFYI